MEKKKILAVDDDAVTLKLLVQQLSAEGYEVFTAKNGSEALMLAKEKVPHLILLDIMMPDLDGGRVGQRLKEEPLTKNIPIVFLTSMLSKEEAFEKGGVIGGNVFIAKPYERKELLETIKKIIA
ncbi:MAG: response regulator [Candidatus Omnitrophota bacterium]